ncbi:MAG: hypothetical protein QNJ98_18940, partial [Planctomycetota bacterium]|nr:hypothetical protein [Planctomycetota bacterium]
MTPPQTDARTASPTPDRVAAAVSETARQHGLAARMRPYAALTWDGSDGAIPGLYLDDLSGIPFLDEITAVEEYIHRARIRAGEGDLFAAVTAPAEGYETYCREHLGLGTTRWVDARHTSDPLAVARSCAEGAPYDTILAAAREAGALRLLPFMSVEPVWALAQQVHHDTGLPIQVVGPPPPVAWIANDKLALHELVTRVLDESWLAETRPCRTAPELATSLLALAEHAVQVGLKRTRCASAMGNAVFDAAAIRAMGPDGVLSEVEAFLERTQWQGDEPVLAVV